MNSLISHFPACLPQARSRQCSCSLSSRRTALSNLFVFLPFPQQIGLALLPSDRINKKLQLRPSAAPKAVIESTDSGTTNSCKPKTAHVKFILQRTCNFGEKYLLSGDDPLFGSWNPTDALSLDWSDGHIWTAELDLPVGKIIQFKFILKKLLGQAIWQPGPDRTLEVWDTGNTIFISDDWEDPKKLTITEKLPTVILADAGMPTESKFGIHGKVPDDFNKEEAEISEIKLVNDLNSVEESISAERETGNHDGDEDDLEQKDKLKSIEKGPVLVPGLVYNQQLGSGDGDNFIPQQQEELEVPRGNLVDEEAMRALEKHGEDDYDGEEEEDTAKPADVLPGELSNPFLIK